MVYYVYDYEPDVLKMMHRYAAFQRSCQGGYLSFDEIVTTFMVFMCYIYNLLHLMSEATADDFSE